MDLDQPIINTMNNRVFTKPQMPFQMQENNMFRKSPMINPPINRVQQTTRPVGNNIQKHSAGYTPMYAQNPDINIDTNQYSSFNRPRKPSTFTGVIQNIVSKIGSNLRPQTPLTQQMSYQDYSAPHRAVFDQFYGQNLRPEFERFQLNPFRRQYANQAAAGNRMFAGNAPQVFRDASAQMEMGFADQAEQARQRYEQMVRDMYNQRLTRMGNSATQFLNI